MKAKESSELETAIKVYRKALKMSRHMAEVHVNLGEAYEEGGELSKAEKAYRKAISLNPNYDKAHESLIEILERKPGEEETKEEKKNGV